MSKSQARKKYEWHAIRLSSHTPNSLISRTRNLPTYSKRRRNIINLWEVFYENFVTAPLFSRLMKTKLYTHIKKKVSLDRLRDTNGHSKETLENLLLYNAILVFSMTRHSPDGSDVGSTMAEGDGGNSEIRQGIIVVIAERWWWW